MTTEKPQGELPREIQVGCSIQILTSASKYIPIRDYHNHVSDQITTTTTSIDDNNDSKTRQKWVTEMQAIIAGRDMINNEDEKIRALDFTLRSDGSVNLASPNPNENNDNAENSHHTLYPPQYRIPPSSIQDLDPRERVRRAELFALGSLIYELHKGEAPFAELDDDAAVQDRYAQGQFPDDVMELELEQGLIIMTCWSVEFASALGDIYVSFTFLF